MASPENGRNLATAYSFFGRRAKITTRAPGSPNTPTTVPLGVNPGTRYALRSSHRHEREEVVPETQAVVTHPASLRFRRTATVKHAVVSLKTTHTNPEEPQSRW